MDKIDKINCSLVLEVDNLVTIVVERVGVYIRIYFFLEDIFKFSMSKGYSRDIMLLVRG